MTEPSSDWLARNPWVWSVVVAGLVAWFVVLWMIVLTILSFASGWHKLSIRFRSEPLPNIETHNLQSASLGWLSFRNALSLGSTQSGLYLRPMVLFRFRHPPLLVPWPEIRVRREAGVLFGRYVVFVLGSAEQVKLKVNEGLGHDLAAEAGIHWPAESV